MVNPEQGLRELAVTLHDLSWRVARFGPAQVGLDPLPASELAVLRAVLAEPDRSVSELAAAISMQSSNVSTAVRALTERGLIEKRPGAHDRRVSLLRPTRKALSESGAIERAVTSTILTALAALPTESTTALTDALSALQELTTEVASVISERMSPHVSRQADSLGNDR